MYLRVTASGSIKSLMLPPSGTERWVMTRQEPSCFGTTPMPEQWKGLKGGSSNGPAIRPCLHSDVKASREVGEEGVYRLRATVVCEHSRKVLRL